MAHGNNIDELLKMSIAAQATDSMKERQVLKMKAGRVIKEVYPAHIIERVQFLNGSKRANKSKAI